MKRYFVTTFGCQMNAHDSERIKGMLESIGLGEAVSQDEADVVVFNTCTIREKPDQRLAAHLAQAKALKDRDPERVIAVGGCYAEAQRERIFERYPFVDVAFGPGSIPHLGDWLTGDAPAERVRDRGRSAASRRCSRSTASGRSRRGCRSRWAATRSARTASSRPCAAARQPPARARSSPRSTGLAAEGVREVTLLGQNVNSYGRDLPPDTRVGFAELLRAVDAIDGIERIRFTSPHPKDFRPDVIAAMAECAAVCEHAHLPLQSGSTRILKAMRRTYSRERYLALVADMRAAIPDLALTTDLIVGFPGETDEDFRATVEAVEEVGFDGAFTFVFSPRGRNRGRRHGRPGLRGGEARADRAADRGRPALGRRAERRAGRRGSRRCSSRGRAAPTRRPPRAHPAEHDRELHRHGGSRASSCPSGSTARTSTTLRGEQAVLAAA